MADRVRRVVAPVVLTACLLGSAGCHGISHNPDVARLPPDDSARTHAKPPAGPDPHSDRLEVRPVAPTCPVGSDYVLIAAVLDENGKPRRNRRVEWLVEGVGAILEVDESGLLLGRGYKVDEHYAVSYTNFFERHISRGNANPAGFTVGPGESWCVVHSTVEGAMHVTAHAPDIANGDKNRVVVTQQWLDASWTPPSNTVGRCGGEQTLTTRLVRRTDGQPLTSCQVRYRLLDGPPALLLPYQSQEAVVVPNRGGAAPVAVVQTAPHAGRNRIAVEVLRDNAVVGRSETTVDWQGAALSLEATAPTSIPAGQEAPCLLAVRNTGEAEARLLTVRSTVPDGFRYVRSDPPAYQEGNELVWTLAEAPARAVRTLKIVYQPTKVGRPTGRVVLLSGDGQREEKTVQYEVTPPQTPALQVGGDGPAAGLVGAPAVYRITVTNTGTGPATNVRVKAHLSGGKEGGSADDAAEERLAVLPAGQSRTVSLALRPKVSGDDAVHVTAAADGELRDEIERTIRVRDLRLTLRLNGPAIRYAGRPLVWDVELKNAGDAPLSRVVVSDALPAEVDFTSATDGGRLDGRQVVWEVGALPPGETKVLHVTTTAARMTALARNVVRAAAYAGDEAPGAEVRVQAEAPISIHGLPAYKLEVEDREDPVEVGGRTAYRIRVTNQGTLPGDRVQIAATAPAQMRVLSATGPAQYQVQGRRVVFAPVDALQPGQTLTYFVETEAVQAGEARFRAELTSGTLREPVVKEESTNVR